MWVEFSSNQPEYECSFRFQLISSSSLSSFFFVVVYFFPFDSHEFTYKLWIQFSSQSKLTRTHTHTHALTNPRTFHFNFIMSSSRLNPLSIEFKTTFKINIWINRNRKLWEENARPAIRVSAMFTSLPGLPYLFIIYGARRNATIATRPRPNTSTFVFAVFGFIGYVLVVYIIDSLYTQFYCCSILVLFLFCSISIYSDEQRLSSATDFIEASDCTESLRRRWRAFGYQRSHWMQREKMTTTHEWWWWLLLSGRGCGAASTSALHDARTFMHVVETDERNVTVKSAAVKLMKLLAQQPFLLSFPIVCFNYD